MKPGKSPFLVVKRQKLVLTCKCHLHHTLECTALLNAAISGIKKLGVNVMLLFNKCIENNERDKLMEQNASEFLGETIKP